MKETNPTPSTLHNFIPIIEEAIRPDVEDVFLSAHMIETLKGKNVPKKILASGLIAYLHMWTYTDVFKTNHAARAVYCNKLRDDHPDMHSLFHKNRLRYGNMTQAIQLVNIYTEGSPTATLLEKIGSKASYEARDFSEKIQLTKEVADLVRETCNKILTNTIAIDREDIAA